MYKKVFVGLAVLLLPVGVMVFKGRPGEPRLPYQLPALARKEEDAPSKFDEYEAVLAGRAPRPLQAQTEEARFSFSRLFKKPAPTPAEKPTQANKKARGKQRPVKQQYFFSYQGNKAAAGEEQAFVKAIVYGEQQVRQGEGVVLQLQAPCPLAERTLAPGTLLYGAARLSGHRLLVTLTAAQHKEKRFPVSLTCYDTDLLPGIAYQGASAWEQPREAAIDRVLRQASKGLLKDIGQGASIAYKAWRRKPTARLEEGRIIYVKPSQP